MRDVRAVVGVWRWRRNPLRRATDRREAWLALTTLLLMVAAAPAVGWVCGTLADDALQGTARAERAQRRPTTAVVLRAAPAEPGFVTDAEGPSEHSARTTVLARWRAPDGAERRGVLAAPSRSAAPGAAVRIWTDRAGRPVPRPMDTATARAHAALAGLGATASAAGLAECGRRLIVRRMVRGRYARIDRAWAAAGPDWGRTGSGA